MLKPSDAGRLLKEALNHITADHWRICVEHVLKLKKKFRHSDTDERNVGPVVIAIDARETEEEAETDDQAGDDTEEEDIPDVKSLKCS